METEFYFWAACTLMHNDYYDLHKVEYWPANHSVFYLYYLTLLESSQFFSAGLSIFRDCPSISQGKRALQSSDKGPLRLPHLAVDGNFDQAFTSDSCTATADTGDQSPWWAIDLGEIQVVNKVKIYNRGDPCCGEDMFSFIFS